MSLNQTEPSVVRPGGILVSERVLTQGPRQTFDVKSPGGTTTSFGADNPTPKSPLEIPIGDGGILRLWNKENSQGPNPRGAEIFKS